MPDEIKGQLSLFSQDLCHGKMSPACSVLEIPQGRTSGLSSKKHAGWWTIPQMYLDLRAGHGSLLGPLWETVFPLPTGLLTPNFSEYPKEDAVSSLSQILEASPHPKYYLSQKACAGILRRAERRGKELPPVLRESLEIQAGLKPQPDTGAIESDPLAFACNQRDEVRDLHDVPGAIQAHPGMKQQTFVAAGFSAGASQAAATIGWQEECTPTLRGTQGGNMVPGICVSKCATDYLTPWDNQQKRIFTEQGVAPTLAGCDGGGGRTPNGLLLTQTCIPEIARTLTARFDSGPCVDREQNFVAVMDLQQDQHFLFENYKMDARYTGPHPVAPTVTASYGMGGNNAPLVTSPQQVYCIAGTAVDRQPQNGGNGIGVQEDAAYTITSTDRHCVAFSMQRSNEYLENEVAMTQSARQYKSATDLICRTDIAGLDCRNMRENGDVCGTLQAKGSGGQSLNTTHPVRVGMIVRRLTPLECERLQGFPDSWTNIPGASDSARYKALGNSVAIPCVEFVMRGIAFVLKNSDGR